MENYFIKYYISAYLLEEVWHVNMKLNGISNREINKLLNEDISEENIDYFLKEFESMYYSMFISEKNVSFFNCGNFDDITFKSVANLFYLKIF